MRAHITTTLLCGPGQGLNERPLENPIYATLTSIEETDINAIVNVHFIHVHFTKDSSLWVLFQNILAFRGWR